MQTRKKIHLKEFEYGAGYVYFLTLCTHDKGVYFADRTIASIVMKEFEYRIQKNEIRVLCYCIMPDHLHVLLRLQEEYGKPLRNFVSAFKRFIVKEVTKIETITIKKFWQINFYEHVVRKDESLQKIANYILHNPVRKGIVESWEEYPYSKLFL